MALAANLEAELGEDGFSLQGSIDGIGAVIDAVAIPDVDLDAGAIGAAAGQLGDLDAGVLGTAVDGVVTALGAVGLDMPVLEDVVGPLVAAIEGGSMIAAAGESFSIDDVLTAGADVDGVGLSAVEARIASISQAASSPGVAALRGLLDDLVPGALDVDATLDELGGHGRAVRELVVSVGGLMAVESASRDIVDGARLVVGMMRPSELAATVSRLQAWRDRDLAGLLVGVDPNDPALVDVVAPPILELMRDLRLAAETLTRGLGFGQAALVGLDVPGLVARLDGGSALLREGVFDPIRTSAERLVEVCRPLLDLELPDPFDSLDAFWELVRGHVATVAAAIEQLDPARLSGALVAGLQPATALVETIHTAAEQVTVAVRAGLEAVRHVVATVDLTPLTDAIAGALDPLVAVLDTVTSLVADAQATIEAASDAVVDAMDTVRSATEGAAAVVAAAFGRVQAILDALGLDDLQATIESGIAPVTEAIVGIRIAPVFDTANDIIETTADVVEAVPLGLLPDDVRAELAEAVAPVKAIDFQADVADVLNARMQQILDGLDTDVLDAIDAAYHDVIAFLEGIDPAAPLAQFEAEVFDPFLERLRGFDPGAALQPIDEALAPIREAIGGFDVGAELLGPIESAIDAVQAELAAFEPATLVAPFQAQVDDLRTAVTEALHIGELNGWLDRAEELVRSWLGRVDPQRLLEALDAAFASVVTDVTGPARGVGAIGSIVVAFMADTAPSIRTDSYERVVSWIGGADGSAEVQGRLRAAADELEALHAEVSALDLGALVASLSPVHRSLKSAVEALPEGSLLRDAIEIEVNAGSPLELLGPFADAVGGYAAALAAAASEARRAAGSERSAVDAVAAGLRDALRPLNAIVDRVRALLGRFGLTATGTSFRDLLAEALSTLTPSRVLEPAVDAIRALVVKLEAMAVDGIIAPAREMVADVEAALAAIDIGFVVDELTAVYADAVGALDALRPSVALGDVLAAVGAAQAELAGFDPLAPVEVAVDAMVSAIDEGAEDLRPTVLFAPGVEVYRTVVSAVGALDVRAILDPLLAALDAVAIQLADGLDGLAVSLKQLQDALPDATAIAAGGGGTGSVSLSAGVG